MSLKRSFTDHEKYGLTEEEVLEGEKYLRKHKTAGAIPRENALMLYELFMVGMTFRELAQQYKQYELGQIILTAALRGWAHDRDKIIMTIRDRVQTTVMRSILEQVDFLTTMMSVANTEHIEKMREYVRDPVNNKPPEMRIESIKEYREVLESLQKLMAGANGSKKGKTIFDAAEDRPKPALPKQKPAASLIEAVVVNDDEEDEDE